ncbi:hypothetical protein LQV05_003263 [Cryptococcus neoformans]|nr:hypothetical protein LQV05_003263 [Cryptococcus neoformans]
MVYRILASYWVESPSTVAKLCKKEMVPAFLSWHFSTSSKYCSEGKPRKREKERGEKERRREGEKERRREGEKERRREGEKERRREGEKERRREGEKERRREGEKERRREGEKERRREGEKERRREGEKERRREGEKEREELNLEHRAPHSFCQAVRKEKRRLTDIFCSDGIMWTSSDFTGELHLHLVKSAERLWQYYYMGAIIWPLGPS